MAPGQKIRVLHITQSVGGIETYLELLFKSINRDVFELHLICPDYEGSLAEKAEQMGVTVRILQMKRNPSPLSDYRHWVILKRWIKEIAPHLIHAHSTKAGGLSRLAAMGGSIPVLYTPNAFIFLGKKGLMYRVTLFAERLLRRYTHFLVAASPSESKRAEIDVGFPADKIRTFTNSIDISELPSTTADKARGESTVTMIGRLAYQKNPEMFIRAAGRIHRQNPGVRFRIVGSGYQELLINQVEFLIRQENLREVLQIVPWVARDQIGEILLNSIIIVVPSRFESFGYVAAEAGIMQKPVVATDIDGLRDVIKDGVTGYLVKSGDDLSMTRRILELIDNPDLCHKMGAAGKHRVEKLFDIKKNIKLLEEVYFESLR